MKQTCRCRAVDLTTQQQNPGGRKETLEKGHQTPRNGELPEFGGGKFTKKIVEVGRVRTGNHPGGIGKLAGKAGFRHQNLGATIWNRRQGVSRSLAAELANLQRVETLYLPFLSSPFAFSRILSLSCRHRSFWRRPIQCVAFQLRLERRIPERERRSVSWRRRWDADVIRSVVGGGDGGRGRFPVLASAGRFLLARNDRIFLLAVACHLAWFCLSVGLFCTSILLPS